MGPLSGHRAAALTIAHTAGFGPFQSSARALVQIFANVAICASLTFDQG